MARDGVVAGKLTIDDDGRIASCNAAVAKIMRSTQSDLIGCYVLGIAALADRDRCVRIFHQIRNDGRPITTVRRIIRADGTHTWVKIGVFVPEWPISRAVAIDVEKCAAPEDWIEPATLLKLAKSMVHGRRERAVAFGTAMFADHAWDLLLAIYIAEAEGRVLSTGELPAALDIASILVRRWMQALSAEALVDYESPDAKPSETVPVRLSASAHWKFEKFLANFYRGTRGLDAMKLPAK